MKASLTRNEGIPALAYATHNVSKHWLCTLKIVKQKAQFGVLLEFCLPSYGVGGEQIFQLRYEGDNLVPSQNLLTNIDIRLPPELLSRVQRHNNPQPKTLSLSLKQPCSVWHPKGFDNFHNDFRKLLRLARSRKTCIFFDKKWLQKENLERLENIFKSSQDLARLPVLPEFERSHQKVDWSILNLIPDADPVARVPIEDLASGVVPSIENAEVEAPPFQDVKHDNPPSYAQVLGKRSRGTGPSLTPDTYDSKRVRNPSYPFSETECATPAPSLCANSMASSSATVQVDVFQEAVTSAVEKVLPCILEKARAESVKKELTQVVKKELPKVVRKELPQVVRAELPQVWKQLFQKTLVGHSPRRCLSPTPPGTQMPDAITMIKGAITTILNETHNDAADHSKEIYNTATLELEERMFEWKGNMEVEVEDHLATFNDELNEMEENSKQNMAEYWNDVEAGAEEVVLKTRRRLDKVSESIINQVLRKLRDPLAASDQCQRARSLPVSKEENKTIAKGA